MTRLTFLLSPAVRSSVGAPVALSWISRGLVGALLVAGVLQAATVVEAQAAPGAPLAVPAPVPAAPELPLGQVIELDPGATCLEADRLTLRVARWREHDTVDARIRVEVHGDASSPTRVSFTVSKLGGASAQRTLANAPEDCDELHSAVALAIALSIDATLMDPRAQKEAELPVPDAPEAEPQPALVLPPAALLPQHPQKRDPDAPPFHLDLGVLFGPSVQVLRGATPAFSPRLWFSPLPWFSLALSGYATQLSDQRVGMAPGNVETSLVTGGLEACFGGQPIEQLDVTGCFGARVGTLRHTGTGFAPNLETSNVWGALSGALQLRAWVVSSVAVGVSIEGFVPVAEYVILVRGVRGAPDQTASLPGFGLNVAIGPVFRFF